MSREEQYKEIIKKLKKPSKDMGLKQHVDLLCRAAELAFGVEDDLVEGEIEMIQLDKSEDSFEAKLLRYGI